MVEVLTISLAGVVYFGEVLVTAALVGTLGVVADVRTHAKLPALVLICQTAVTQHALEVLKQTAAHNICKT